MKQGFPKEVRKEKNASGWKLIRDDGYSILLVRGAFGHPGGRWFISGTGRRYHTLREAVHDMRYGYTAYDQLSGRSCDN